MKLHLGCGEIHLDGYVNIDYPPDLHTVQISTAVDEYHNILELSYPANSINEIRLHHVFEHFWRSTAVGLLAGWWSWLEPGGLLHIEVPDFDRTSFAVLNPFNSPKRKMVGLRHIFGSQEAGWANHYEGWSSERLGTLLKGFGFEIEKIQNNAYKGTYNFHVYAKKTSTKMSKLDFEDKARSWLSCYLVDESEQKMLNIWINQFQEQLTKSWAEK
ncbi:MAG: hypothetical protein C0412_11620 [Flavobacterium sp.]|nr:hypothetical protein [Flavobacterium sp.]